MGDPRQMMDLVEFVPDVDFFAKDTLSRFVAVGKGMLERVGLVSAQEFIIRTRFQSACDDLLATSLTISDIAIRNGFYGQSSFTSQFRLHTPVRHP